MKKGIEGVFSGVFLFECPGGKRFLLFEKNYINEFNK
jgi:hypothetical protein